MVQPLILAFVLVVVFLPQAKDCRPCSAMASNVLIAESVESAAVRSAAFEEEPEDSIVKKRLMSPARIRGSIGGESHDGYEISARKGQTMTVQISWRRRDDNRAEFTISECQNFFNAAPVEFGTLSHKGKRWTGKIPATATYYLYVVAHPSADYTLRVKVK